MLIRSEAGTLVGGGPRTFQKYETGELLPSRAISSALMLLDHDPASLAVLRGGLAGDGIIVRLTAMPMSDVL